MLRRVLCGLGVLVLFSAVTPVRAQELTVAAAADLRPALEEIATHFQAASGAQIKTIYDRREISTSRFKTARRLISSSRQTLTIPGNWKLRASRFPAPITNTPGARLSSWSRLAQAWT